MGATIKLLDEEYGDIAFANDPVYEKIKQIHGVQPRVLEIMYNGTASASATELGGAYDTEFTSASREATDVVVTTTRANTDGGSYFTFYVHDGTSTITTYYAWMIKYHVQTITCVAASELSGGEYFTITDSQASPTTYYVWMDQNGDGTTQDPGATGTGVACDISGSTTADDVGGVVATALNALAGFGASNTTGVVTVTHATAGSPTADAVDTDTGFTLAVTEIGGTDPGVTGTGAECDIKAATSEADVATVVQGVITALADVTATVSTATITIENDNTGAVTATTDGNTGWTITQTEDSNDDYGGAPLHYVSASANDDDVAAGHVRKITTIGYTATQLKSEEKALDGTTRVESSEQNWTKHIHTGASDWGTGGADAAGAITITDLDGTTTYNTISAGENESNGCTIWVPPDFHALIAEWDLSLDDAAIANGGDGAFVEAIITGDDPTHNNRIGNTDPDNNVIDIAASRESPTYFQKWPLRNPIHGSDKAKIVFKESKINNAPIISFHTHVVIWYDPNH